MIIKYALVAFIAIIWSACNDDSTPSPSNDVKDEWSVIGEGQTDNGEMTVQLYASDILETGYQNIQVSVSDKNGSQLSDVEVMFMPIMDMGDMKHSAPVEQPAAQVNAQGRYEGAVVFQMPGKDAWTVRVTVKNPSDGVTGSITFPVEVVQPEWNACKVFQPKDSGAPLIVTWINPSEPQVGVNDLEWTVHRRESMMSFPPVENFEISIEPTMPSMGHGSPNNVDPVHMRSGHYMGKVNFTMTGVWRIDFDLSDETHVVDDSQYFEITIP